MIEQRLIVVGGGHRFKFESNRFESGKPIRFSETCLSIYVVLVFLGPKEPHWPTDYSSSYSSTKLPLGSLAKVSKDSRGQLFQPDATAKHIGAR
jgi:hypothetical protein